MALIRQANAATAARDAIVLDLGDITRQADAIKARAREAADKLLDEARKERERLIKNAAEQGRREGIEVGTVEGRRTGEEQGRSAALAEYKERLTALDAAWTAALARLEQDKDRILMESRLDVLQLAVRLGELVTKRAIEVRPEVVADQLAAVLAQLSRPRRLIVRINPVDRSLTDAAVPRAVRLLGGSTHVELVEDAVLDRGSVVARTESGGEIDASIQTQLARIADALLPASASPPGGGTP